DWQVWLKIEKVALRLQTRQDVAKRVIFEHRSGAYLRVREHRSAKNCSLQPGITRNATVVSGDACRLQILLKRGNIRRIEAKTKLRAPPQNILGADSPFILKQITHFGFVKVGPEMLPEIGE